jgi:hypothetical protein
MLINTTRRRSERLRRRKHTLFKKAYDLGREYLVDVAVVIYQEGRYYTFRTLDQKSWPPSMEEIVSTDVSGNRYLTYLTRNNHFPCQETCYHNIWRRNAGEILKHSYIA